MDKKITKDDERFGKRVAKFRKEAGLTQEELAERIGLSTVQVGYIEMGKHLPRAKNLRKIAKVLGKKVGELFPY